MADTTVFDEFVFLCALLSPFTSEDEIHELKLVVAGGRIDWTALARTVNRSELAPALWLALERTGLSAEIPETFRAYLEEIHQFNLDRNEALLGQLLEVVQLLNDIEVTPLLLKGGAALATDLFPEPGMRFMWDLDLLVPEERLEQSVAALLAGGYEILPEDDSEALTNTVSSPTHHHAPLIRTGAPARVELHHRLLSKEIGLLDPDEVWGDSCAPVSCRLPGASALVLSPTSELLYCFAHSELAHGHHGSCRVDARHLHHFAYLCYRYREQIDWNCLSVYTRHPQFGHIFTAYLHMAKSLFRFNPPILFDADPYAERHFRAVMTARNGWGLRIYTLRTMFRELIQAFSSDRLRYFYQQKDGPLIWLRLRHLRYLLDKYRRLEPWRLRLRGMAPF